MLSQRVGRVPQSVTPLTQLVRACSDTDGGALLPDVHVRGLCALRPPAHLHIRQVHRHRRGALALDLHPHRHLPHHRPGARHLAGPERSRDRDTISLLLVHA
eukprot:4891424-Pyramimonas_sp.AAC.1